MCTRSTLIFTVILFFSLNALTQEIVQQEKLDNIDKVLNSKDGNYLLVKSADKYTLIEEKSRIQLGSMNIPDYNNGYPGQGKTLFVNGSKFLVNTLSEILLVDILNRRIDTLHLGNEFPEMIENFHVLPGNKNQILIATKFYPMDKNETIQFVKHNKKGEARYDDSRNCRMYLFDYSENKILKSVEIPFSLTAISDNGTEIFAGTFDGKILKIGPDLLFEEIFTAGVEPVFYVKNTNDKFLVIPHLEKAVLHDLGKGELRVFDHSGRLVDNPDLPEQAYPIEQDEGSFMTILPSDLVFNVLFLKKENAFLINYGFNKLLKYNISSGAKKDLQIDKKFAAFHNFYAADSQILITASDQKKGAFNNPSNLAIYDLELEKDISLFSNADPVIKYNELKKIYTGKHYYYFGKTDFYGELSVLYPSNQSRPIFIKYPDGYLDIDQNSNLLLVASNQFIYGNLDISKIKQDSITFRLGWKADSDKLHSEVLKPYLDSRTLDMNLPYGISNVRAIGKDTYLINGYNEESKSYFMVIGQKGKVLFDRTGIDRSLIEKREHVSSSGDFLAFDYRKRNSQVLEIWDWKKNQLVFTNELPESTTWTYRFDPKEEVLWLKVNDENDFSSIAEVDLALSSPKKNIILSKISTSDFVADKQQNKIATTDARGFSILELSTGKKLWSISNPDFSQTMQQSPKGFDLGTEKHFYTINAEDFTSVYFTSFEGYQPIELSSDLYYSGEKNALKNIAFVVKEHGYLPSDYDLYLNRPDKVLPKSGSTDSDYHKLIGKAVEKRTATLPTRDFNAFLDNSPELIILERNDIPTYTEEQTIILKFQLLSSSGTNLKSYHVDINGVPVYGKDGRKIDGLSTDIESEVQLNLSKGPNTIQFYGTDEKGFISNKEVINIYADYKESSQIHLVLISADTYENQEYNLKYPVKDARDLAKSLQKRYGSKLTVDSLFNEGITDLNLDKIRDKLTGISVNDRVIFFLSGHGVLDSNLEFRFATPDMDFDNVDSYGISNARIEEILLSSPAREKLLLIDACHSGEFDREQYATLDANLENKEVKMFDGQKGAIASDVRPSNSTFELMNQLFTDVSETTGIKVISAAAGNSFALESDQWNNGVFTYSLISTLEKHQSVSTSELKKETFSKVVKLTNGYQQPTSRGETIEFDFSL